MSKFGELISTDVPVLLNFFTEWNEDSADMHKVLRDVAAALGDNAKVIKINVDKNKSKLQSHYLNKNFMLNTLPQAYN